MKVREPDFSWRPESRELEYRAVVQRLAPGTQSYQGQMTVELIDLEGRALDAAYLSTPTHTIGFKYFQRISGIITVPEVCGFRSPLQRKTIEAAQAKL